MILSEFLRKIGVGKLISIKTFKNISTLMVGTFISAVIPVLFSPVMSRIFTTSDYGLLGLYMGITGLIGVLSFSHYSQAIMFSKDIEEAKQLIWLTLLICSLISILSMLIIAILYFLTDVISVSVIGKWYFFIPLSVMLNGITTTLLIWANRLQKYKLLASNRMIQAILTVVIQISFGLLIKDETGLMAGLIVGQVISVMLLLKPFVNNNKSGIGPPKSSYFKKIAVKHKNLVFYSTPSEFLNNLINQAPIFLLQKFGGVSYVGSFNFTQRILALPQQLISSAIIDVFKQKSSSAYNENGSFHLIFVKTFKVLVLLAIIPFFITIFFAPSIFSFVFGKQWYEAGVFAQFLSILFFFRFVVSPLTFSYYIVGKLKEDFILHIFFLISTVAAFYIGNHYISNKINLILVYSITYSLVYIVYLLRSYGFSKGNKSNLR